MIRSITGSTCKGNLVTARALLVLLLLWLISAGAAQARGAAPRLASDLDISTTGAFRLTWETQAERVELQESDEPAFQRPRTIYRGPDRASVISGKPNGTWHYRIRALAGDAAGTWSAPLSVSVAHHSLVRGLMFFALGLMVFVATVWLVIRGARKVE